MSQAADFNFTLLYYCVAKAYKTNLEITSGIAYRRRVNVFSVGKSAEKLLDL